MPSGRFIYGTKGGTVNSTVVGGDFVRFVPDTFDQESQSIHIGPGTQRAGQRGLYKIKLASYAGGLNTRPNVQLVEEAIDTYIWNPGIQTRFRGAAVLPYKLNTAGSFTSDEDISGSVAANVRAHDVLSSLGSSGERLYTAINHKVYRSTSLSDPTPEVCYTTTTSTDEITCMAELVVNGTRYLTIATNGATNDVEYVADPTGTWSGNMTTLIELSAGDYITAMAYLPTVGPGVNIVVGKIGGNNGIWWMDTSTIAPWTMKPVVLTSTKDDTNTSNAIQTTGATLASVGVTGNYLAADGDDWVSVDEITDDDESYANTDGGSASGWNDALVGLWDFSSILPPSGIEPVAYEFSYQRLEVSGTSSFNTTFVGLVKNVSLELKSDGTQLFELNLTQIGDNKEPDRSTWAGTVETITIGDTTSDLWGSSLSVSDLRSLDFGVMIVVNQGSSDAGTAGTEAWKLNIAYRATGSTIAFPLGGYMINRNPVFPNRISIVTPHEDDISAITKPREMWHLDFVWQADQERPTFSFSQPNEGGRYVWHATPHLGGYLMAIGNSSADRGILLKHSDASGNLRDFAFFGVHDTYTARINQLISHGSWAVLDVYYENSGGSVVDRQWVWLSPSGKYYTDFLMQSYSNHTIAAQPIPHGTSYIDTHQDTIRTFYPNSTDTAAAWQFIPPDPSLDPRVNYTSETKTMRWTGTSGSRTEDTGLEIRSAKMDTGHEEANKNMLLWGYHGNRISASSGADHGSVTVRCEADGGDFSTPDVSHEFTASYEAYNVPNAGLKYDYLQFEMVLTHDAGSAETPDACSVLISSSHSWPQERRLILFCNRFDGGLWQFMSGLEAVEAASGGVAPLYIETVAQGGTNTPPVLAHFEQYVWNNVSLDPDELASNPLPEGKEVGLVFVTKPGTP